MLLGGYIPACSSSDTTQRTLMPLEDIRVVVARLSQRNTLPCKGRPLFFVIVISSPDLLPLPLNVDVMSQPVSVWNTGKALDKHFPRLPYIEWH